MRLIDADAFDKRLVRLGALSIKSALDEEPTIEAEPIRYGRCDVCTGKAIMTQDCINGYSLEVDAEQQELLIWRGDECLAIFQIDYCPNCGSKLHGGADDVSD